mmetsp:Transcript_19894/g.34236  ORF Transcript_19894/g.34236 Transcript_19894/m.34236 type:complete len:89 (+) Transcript_19894:592-858(+)
MTTKKMMEMECGIAVSYDFSFTTVFFKTSCSNGDEEEKNACIKIMLRQIQSKITSDMVRVYSSDHFEQFDTMTMAGCRCNRGNLGGEG